jgi:hypothetical protein
LSNEVDAMSATLDLIDARRFTDELSDRLRRCDNGEGMICSNLEESISHYIQVCDDLRDYINAWARAIFAGQIAFDAQAETLLNRISQQVLRRAKSLAAQGRTMEEDCFDLGRLDALHYHIADFDYLLENWVSPRLAVGPAARVKLPDAAVEQAAQRVKELPPLPVDWQPTDPEQLVFFQKQRTK